MKAVKLQAPRRASVVEEPTPIAGPGEVVIRIDATGLCGSDLSTWLGHHPFAGRLSCSGTRRPAPWSPSPRT